MKMGVFIIRVILGFILLFFVGIQNQSRLKTTA